MQLIRRITENDFSRHETPQKWPTYHVRKAARAILLDAESRIALMHIANDRYYKLPGDGVDEGEDADQALKRELLEEVGAHAVEVITEVGQIDEYRDAWEMKSEHVCFIARLTGPVIQSARTEKEISKGYETVWTKDIDEAIRIVESDQPAEYGQDFERLRELTFLNYARSSKLID